VELIVDTHTQLPCLRGAPPQWPTCACWRIANSKSVIEVKDFSRSEVDPPTWIRRPR